MRAGSAQRRVASTTMATADSEQSPLLVSANLDDPINASSDGQSHADRNSLGFFAVVFLTVNATLGAGLLNIPFAFSESGGILPATFVQIVSHNRNSVFTSIALSNFK